MTPHVQVLVLGAGFSGLAAALRLREHNLEAQIVEARDRVGGRTHTRYLSDGLHLDLGGQWLGPTQTRMYELVEEHGVELFPLQEHGRGLVFHHGERGEGLSEPVGQILQRIDELATDVDLESPELTPDAAELDKQTFRTWLHAHSDPDTAAHAGRILSEALLGKDPGEVSLLQVLFYVKSGSGVTSLTSTQGGAQQDRLIGGPFALAEKMADRLGRERIHFEFPVTGLTQEGDLWRATSRDGREITAEQVISTIPQAVLGGVDFSPQLPTPKRRAVSSMTPGHAMKFHAVYSSPLWREQGLSGVFNTQEGLITEAVDNSVPGNPRGVLTFFVYGDQSAQLDQLSADERRVLLLGELAERLSEPRLREPEEFVEFSWDEEPYTAGCFSSSFTVGGLHRYGSVLRQPWQGVHFAGTETSEVWNGYFEGAVRAGEREADRIAQGRAEP